MAAQGKFEFPTFRLTGDCSNQLSYWAMVLPTRIEQVLNAYKALVLPLN